MSSPAFSNPWGFLQPASLWGRYNNLRFMIQQMLSKVQTATIVQVTACSNDGGVSPVGTVDVQILVNQMGSLAGQMVGVPHVTMLGLPYLRIQGGENAIIIDPQVGDIGIAVFASRDITNVKSTKAQANPGSFRMHDFADGMYLGGLLNGTPTQFIQFSSSGITLQSLTAVLVQAPSVTAYSTGTINLVAPDVAAYNTGGTPLALVNSDWLDWFTTNIQPFLVGLGYTGVPMPSYCKTTILKGE
jgi:hypothetical protein